MNIPMTLPPAFIQRLQTIIPTEMQAEVWRSFSITRAACFRVNLLQSDTDNVVKSLQAEGIDVQRCTFKDDTLFVTPAQRQQALASDAYQKGWLYSQSLASQLCASALQAVPGETVLDMCAAPGGKTLQLACLMQGEGELLANEAVKKRFFKLRAVLQQQGAANFVTTLLGDGRALWRRFPAYFDRILVDAPCSTEARFRADDVKTFRYWSPRKIKEMRHKQKGLLRSAIRCLKPGGSLIYATCSFSPEENEQVVSDALKQFPDQIDIAPLTLPGVQTMPGLTSWQSRTFPAALKQAMRILPDQWSEAMFICCIVKTL